MTKRSITLPYQYEPRDYQVPFWRAMLGGCRNASLVWHRRAGKDKSALNWMIYAAATQRVGTYYYFFPTYAQGKKIIWDGADGKGLRFLDHFPPDLIKKNGTNETDMSVELTNGSICQIVGTDKYNSVVGTNPIGCIFSEYSLQDPRAHDLVEPILLENGGWSVFAFTPRGQNHGYKLWQYANSEPGWFSQLLTVDDTKKEDGTPLITKEQIDAVRRRGVDEELIQQEYYCSFSGAIQGAYYSKQIELAEKEKRITRVPHDPSIPVITAWDLGYDDSMTIWFMQRTPFECRYIDYLEHSGEGFPYYAAELKADDRAKYLYAEHRMPHDIKVHDLSTGLERKVAAEKLGIYPIEVAAKLHIDDGIQASRIHLARSWFDAEKCARGIECLKNYKKEYDEERGTFKKTPYHSWASHGADAYRTSAISDRPHIEGPAQQRYDSDFDLFAPARRNDDFEVFA